MMALAAYLTRGLQLVLGSSKRARAQRAEELHDDAEADAGDGSGRDVVLGEVSAGPSRATSTSQAASSTTPLGPGAPRSPPPLRLQEHHYAPENAGAEAVTPPPGPPEYPAQDALPPTRAERWAARLTRHLDAAIFAAVFLFVGVPVYYATGYAMPVQLSANVLCYFAAMAIPAAWRRYLHPVLVSSLLTVLVIWPLAAVRGDGLHAALAAYRTGANYLRLWGRTPGPRLPGAGDVFGTALDASIVALALPMFQYRRELRAHSVAIVVPNVLIAVGSLLAYPPLCFAVGITAERSLAFASRSLTLALATPATRNLGGDVNTVAALAIVSGILGVLVGQRLMAWMRIPEGEFPWPHRARRRGDC